MLFNFSGTQLVKIPVRKDILKKNVKTRCISVSKDKKMQRVMGGEGGTRCKTSVALAIAGLFHSAHQYWSWFGIDVTGTYGCLSYHTGEKFGQKEIQRCCNALRGGRGRRGEGPRRWVAWSFKEGASESVYSVYLFDTTAFRL